MRQRSLCSCYNIFSKGKVLVAYLRDVTRKDGRHFLQSDSQFRPVHRCCSTRSIPLSCQHTASLLCRDNIFLFNLARFLRQRRFSSDNSYFLLNMTRRWSSACPGGSGWVSYNEISVRFCLHRCHHHHHHHHPCVFRYQARLNAKSGMVLADACGDVSLILPAARVENHHGCLWDTVFLLAAIKLRKQLNSGGYLDVVFKLVRLTMQLG